MSQDLTSSAIARQYVLNKPYALSHLALGGLQFEGAALFSKA